MPPPTIVLVHGAWADGSGWNAGCATAGFCGTYSDATSGVQTVEISIRQGAGNYWEGSSFASAGEVWNTTTLSAGDWSFAFAAGSFPADGSAVQAVMTVADRAMYKDKELKPPPPGKLIIQKL